MTKLAITIGDLNGIGPEVILKSLRYFHDAPDMLFVIIGPKTAFVDWAERLGLPDPQWPTLAENAVAQYSSSGVVVVEPAQMPAVLIEPGRPTANSGAIAARSIITAANLALDRAVDGIVTTPISKHALKMAGYNYPGHTELLASLAHVERPVMLLLSGDFRVAVATTHLPLKEVPGNITTAALVQTLAILQRDLIARFGVAHPKIAVTGLNPHAGEDGDFGDEEMTIIAPAIAQVRAAGVDAEGPFSADALFSRRAASYKFDAFLAMYHDQGLIPLKMKAAGLGVNFTCGLPFVRTSPDHGTAYDIAGQNRANTASMMEAIRVAISLAQKGTKG